MAKPKSLGLTLVLFLCAGIVSGQDTGDPPETPVDIRPFQFILPRDHLFGDWNGLRTKLEDAGFTPTLTFVTDIAGNPIGGRDQGVTHADNLGLDLLFDLDKLAGLKGGSFLISMSQRSGSSLSREYIGNVFTVQQVFGGQTFLLIDVAYDEKLFDERVEFRLGRIATGDDFLVSPYNYLFMQNGFDGNPVGIFFNSPGMTAYPKRPRDAAGLGLIYGDFSSHLRHAQERQQRLDPSVGVQNHETVLELTYRLYFQKTAAFFQPDLQYIIRPGGTGRIDNALVLGCQIGFNFWPYSCELKNMNSSPPDAATRKHFYILGISVVAALGGFLFGFDSGVINGTVGALNQAFHTSSLGSGFNVASILLGCAVGAFLAGTLADKFGRRAVLIIAAILFVWGSWGSGVAHGSLEFILYRFMGGLAVGAASIICPAYISEIAPSEIRGRLSSLQQLAIVLGLFFAFFSNYLFAGAAGTAGSIFWFGFQAWQWMFWAEIIPAALFFIGLLFIPESPRYLVTSNRPGTAQNVLTRLGHPDPAKKVREIQETVRSDHKPRMSDLYDRARKKIRPILWVGIGLAAFQQLVGINIVFYYGEVLWRAAGFSESNALLQNVISGAVNIGSTFVAIALIDKLGRKPLLVFGSIGMAITLAALTWIFGSAALDANGKLALKSHAGLAALIAANAYIFCFGVSWGPVMWVMLGEMFQNQFRGAALSVSGFVQWISNFAITMTFPILLASFGLGGAYGLYTLFAAISILFVVKLIRETKGKPLEEM